MAVPPGGNVAHNLVVLEKHGERDYVIGLEVVLARRGTHNRENAKRCRWIQSHFFIYWI
jgi:hypothetical protein